jgi:hypothetical protein
MGKGLCQYLADRKPEAQPERVEYYEEHPKPVDQDTLTGLSHFAPFSRADDPPGNLPFPARRDRYGAGHHHGPRTLRRSARSIRASAFAVTPCPAAALRFFELDREVTRPVPATLSPASC